MAEEENNNGAAEEPTIHVDEDWKAQAKAEKERLAEGSAEEKPAGREPGAGELPEAGFPTLVNSLMMQALMAMGGIEDPNTGKRVIDLNLAKFHIDMLGVLAEKTKGNLDGNEQKMLEQALHELRMGFLGFARQQQQQPDAEAGGGAEAP